MTDTPKPASPAAPDFTGRVGLITGACGGIGRAAAFALARAGAQLVLTDREEAALVALDDALRAEGLTATLYPMTLLRPSQVDRMALALAERFGRLDLLVHAATTLGTLSPVALSDPRDWEEVMKVNVLGLYRLIRACEPLLRKSDAGRAVVLTCSDPVEQARPFWGGYSASKAAVETMVRTWANEIRQTPIRVSMLDPGPVRSGLRRKAYPGEDEQTLAAPEIAMPPLLHLLGPQNLVHGAVTSVVREAKPAAADREPVAGSDEALRQRVLQTFGIEALPFALFYHFESALRFDLGGDIPMDRPARRFNQAHGRAAAVLRALFAPTASLYALISTHGHQPTPADLSALRDYGLDPNQIPLAYVTAPDPADPEQPPRNWYAAPLADLDQAAELLWLDITAEMPIHLGTGEAQAPWQRPMIYFVDFARALVLHAYDDRGMDVIAMDPAMLKPCYAQFKDWLLVHDLARMTAAFD